MESTEFTLDGERFQLTRDMVVKAMRSQTPGTIQTYAVDVDGMLFPVKQVLAQSLQIGRNRFITTRAQDILRKLDFRVIDMELDGDAAAPSSVPSGPIRAQALALAVQFRSGGDRDLDDVLHVAGRFAEWLSAS